MNPITEISQGTSPLRGSSYPRLMLAGTSSRVGKTTLTIGLISELKRQGLKVQAFKAGPDYIDPSYHALASGSSCRNLDSWMLSKDRVLELFERQARLVDISVIEGAMGLYDGFGASERGSSAHLAKILGCPVILIVDARSLSRSAAAVALGYKEFDSGVDLRGVILNNIGSQRHYRSIKLAVQKHTGLPVLGFLPREKALLLPERHLGLVPAAERKPLAIFFRKARELVAGNLEVNRLIAISRSAPPLPDFKRRLFNHAPEHKKINIAVAKDRCFNFYYQDNLDILRHNGANLIEFSPLKDKALPESACGVYIGGGFPELFAAQLARNSSLKKDILIRAKKGMPVYAECAGLMYLMKAIIGPQGKALPMVGIFGSSVKMNDRLAAMGYVGIEAVRENILSGKGAKTRAHVFHWSYIDSSGGRNYFAYKVKKDGKKPFRDGFIKWNVLASYAHLHFGANPGLAKNFINRCRLYAEKRR